MNVLITAGNRGLGLEWVKQLSDRGDSVITTARNPDDADELQKLADEDGRDITIRQLDIADPESVATLADDVESGAIDEVDVLLNNAGRLSRGGSPDDFEFDVIEADFQVNAIGTLRVTEALLPAIRRADGQNGLRKIVNITSKMGSIEDNGSGGSYAYRMSKAALNMATRSLALDLEGEDIIAFVMHPGWVQTRMGGDNALITPEESISNMLQRVDEATEEQSGTFVEWDGGYIPW